MMQPVRALFVALALALAWLVAVALRLWMGGQHYLEQLLGSRGEAERLFAALRREGLELPGLGLDVRLLLPLVCLGLSVALVGLVLAPADALLRRRVPSQARRRVVGAVLAAAVAGLALSAVHPLLSLRSVPEGPRTLLNYACEAAGYGWVNAIVYVGAIAAGLAVAGRRREVATRDAAGEHAPPTPAGGLAGGPAEADAVGVAGAEPSPDRRLGLATGAPPEDSPSSASHADEA